MKRLASCHGRGTAGQGGGDADRLAGGAGRVRMDAASASFPYRPQSPPFPRTRESSGFTLVELLVALAVFAAMAAAAYGGLAAIARTRIALVAQQQRFAAVVRAVSDLERDLGQAVARPVRDNYGAAQPALIGTSNHVELTRLGFANPRAEPRSNLERAVYGYDNGKLQRGRYAVLDRAPGSVPTTRTLLDRVGDLRLRYLDSAGVWREVWPPPDAAGGDALSSLPRAVEFRLVSGDLGEVRRVIELPSALPERDAGSAGGPGGAPGGEANGASSPAVAPPRIRPPPGGVE